MNDELVDIVMNIHKFNQDLTDLNIKQAETIEEQKQEIERLNNIINEFNKLIENEINESKLEEDYDRVDVMEYCLATLRELKGSNNNE